MDGQSDINFLLTRFSILLLIYSLSVQIVPNSKIPIAIFLIGMTSSIYKTSAFSWLIRRFVQQDLTSDRQDLINAVASFKSYRSRAVAWNNRKIKALKRINYEDFKQVKEIGYFEHLHNTEKAIDANSKLAKRIAEDAITKYGITEIEQRSALYRDNSRVIEALCHFARDWTYLGEPELQPLINYIKSNIDKNIPSAQERAKTVVIVPGSGLGRVAHELASTSLSFASVQSVEFSYLMYLCNDFVYSKTPESYKIHPFIHTYSHHVAEKNHLRSTTFKRINDKPQNLVNNYGDFRKFQIPNPDQYETVVIVTAFFIDTAQNLFEYFDGIEKLIGEKKGLWINIGPLKYGTAPKVELSLEEIRKLRKLRGWKDLDEPKPYGTEISGYLTDTEGLWQGYYGLGRWTSSFTKPTK